MILARLLSATPQTDGEHWDLSFRWHFDAWHTDLYAQNPAPYQRNPQIGNPGRPPYPWLPGLSVGKFDVKLDTTNSPPTLDIYGQPPVNALPVGFAPQCPLYATVSITGGTIPSGSYLLVVSANNNGPVSTYMIQAVIPAGTTTGSIVISGVVWQAAAPAIALYIGTNSLQMYEIEGIFWTGSSPDTYGNPTVFTIGVGGLNDGGSGLPDPVFNSFLFKAKYIWHGGVWFDFATSTGTSGGHPTVTNPSWAWGVNQWAGYELVRYDAGTGFQTTFTVSSNTATTLTLEGIAGPPAGAALVMRAQAWSITASTIGDANFVNGNMPSGLTVNAETGRMIRIVGGTGINQPPVTIQSNTATVFTIAGTWAVTPDATSIWIVEDGQWQYSIPGSTVQQGATVGGIWHGPTTPLVGSIPVITYGNTAFLIEALTVDVDGNWCVERYSPVREIFVPAQSPVAGVTINGAPVADGATPGF